MPPRRASIVNPTTTAIVVFACAFGGALGGLKLRRILPEHHLSAESKDTVKVGIALIATMTALVLGLVTSSAKTSFDRNASAIKQAAAELLSLDRALHQYGRETDELRKKLLLAMTDRTELIWADDVPASGRFEPRDGGRELEHFAASVRALTPQSEEQRWVQSRASRLTERLLEARWLFFASQFSSVPVVFLTILTCWLAITFASFGLFSPRNVTVVAVMFLCAVSVAGAVFLIMELDGPFDGLIMVSSDPMRYALAHLNR
jgi:hypothetical protein